MLGMENSFEVLMDFSVLQPTSPNLSASGRKPTPKLSSTMIKTRLLITITLFLQPHGYSFTFSLNHFTTVLLYANIAMLIMGPTVNTAMTVPIPTVPPIKKPAII